MNAANKPAGAQALMLQSHLSAERLSTYLQRCGADLDLAIALYEWNTLVSGALWETLSHVEVVLRNTMAARLAQRHQRLGRPGSWLDNRAQELDSRAATDVADAKHRLQIKGKRVSEGQVVSELSFGFWRFLISRRYQTTFWPELAGGFRHAPNRAIATVEEPVKGLHEFRNRIAHHQRVWNLDLNGRYADMLVVLGYIDPDVRAWANQTSHVPAVLRTRPPGT